VCVCVCVCVCARACTRQRASHKHTRRLIESALEGWNSF